MFLIYYCVLQCTYVCAAMWRNKDTLLTAPILVCVRTYTIIMILRCIAPVRCMFLTLLGRPEPPFRTGLCFTGDVSSFFVSPLVLLAPSTDRSETLPHGRNVAELYKPTPKTLGAVPPKN